jgi:hypothetical protein
MTDPRAAAIDALLDRQAIWDCMLRYARGVDRLDEQLIRSSYWADAHDSHGQLNGSLEDFLVGWLPGQEEREVAHHMLGNHQVELVGDSAHVETYFISASKGVDSTTLELVAGRYEDRFEKRAGEWRIATRLVLLDWQCTTDASGMAKRLARSHRGSRGPQDPSYERPVRLRHRVENPTG